jgi:hypothetical protein
MDLSQVAGCDRQVTLTNLGAAKIEITAPPGFRTGGHGPAVPWPEARGVATGLAHSYSAIQRDQSSP